MGKNKQYKYFFTSLYCFEVNEEKQCLSSCHLLEFMEPAFFLVQMSLTPTITSQHVSALSFIMMRFMLTTHTFRFLELNKKSSSSSFSTRILFLAFISPFFEGCCCSLCEEFSGFKDELDDLIGVPILICFCFLCFFSYAFFARSGDNRPCSIILYQSTTHEKTESLFIKEFN